jgi:hypothetical protein
MKAFDETVIEGCVDWLKMAVPSGTTGDEVQLVPTVHSPLAGAGNQIPSVACAPAAAMTPRHAPPASVAISSFSLPNRAAPPAAAACTIVPSPRPRVPRRMMSPMLASLDGVPSPAGAAGPRRRARARCNRYPSCLRSAPLGAGDTGCGLGDTPRSFSRHCCNCASIGLLNCKERSSMRSARAGPVPMRAEQSAGTD